MGAHRVRAVQSELRCVKLILILFTIPSMVRASTLSRISLNSIDPQAVCNDGTSAMVYWKPSERYSNTNKSIIRPDERKDKKEIKKEKISQKSPLWLLYLQGGGMCYDEGSCKRRAENNLHLVSSERYPETKDISGIFDESPDISPLYDANMAFVSYCTSDAYFADSGTPSNFSEPLRSSFVGGFRGLRVIRTAISFLISKGLKSGDRLVFGGCSAGARGALANIDELPVPLGVETVGLLDSPLWMDIEPGSKDVVNLLDRLQKLSEIADVTQSYGLECKEKHRCLLGEHRLQYVHTPYFLIANQLDSYQIHTLKANETTRKHLRERILKVSRSDIQPFSALYLPACERHCLSLKSRYMLEISVDGSSVSNSFSQWLDWIGDKHKPLEKPLKFIDNCTGIYECGSCGRKQTAKLLSITIGGVANSRMDPGYTCVNLDWWPSSKCDKGTCPWQKGSILSLNLSQIKPFLKEMGNGTKLRLGGSLSDFVKYTDEECHGFINDNSTRLGFNLNGSCLSWRRWKEFHDLCKEVECEIIFQINALNGRSLVSPCEKTVDCRHNSKANPCCTKWHGDWDSSNTIRFLERTKKEGLHLFALQFGNEVNGKKGIAAKLPPEEYAKSFLEFVSIVKRIWTSPETRPKIMGPNGNFEPEFFQRFQEIVGDSLEILTIHNYILGPGHFVEKVKRHIRNVTKLERIRMIAPTIVTGGRSVKSIWIGEAGGAYNSGSPDISNTFLSSFWYNHNMATLATLGYSGFCRQAFVGGHYSLLKLDKDELKATPDFISLLLWRNLIGEKALITKTSDRTQSSGFSLFDIIFSKNDSPESLRSFAFCGKNTSNTVVLVLNFNAKITESLQISMWPISHSYKRVEYHLTAADKQFTGVLVNGKHFRNISKVLKMGRTRSARSTLKVKPMSIAFIVLEGAAGHQCIGKGDSFREVVERSSVRWTEVVMYIGGPFAIVAVVVFLSARIKAFGRQQDKVASSGLKAR